MTEEHQSSRREFLSGRSARRILRQTGDELADALTEAESLSSIPHAKETIRLETRAMACSWSVVMNPGPARQVMTASDALDIVHRVEDQLTVYRDDSEISRVNREAAASPRQLEEDVIQLLRVCQTLWEETSGAFDPATAPLIQLWREARREGRVPSDVDVRSCLEVCGFQHVEISEHQRTVHFRRKGVALDFGAIGKGWAIDQMATHLHHEEQTDFLVHGGFSSVRGAGGHGGFDGWPIGIRDPLFMDRRYATLLLRDEAMSTSGSNVQFFRFQGRRYGHILDPRTGWPAEGLLSVTVVCPSAAQADALSTAFYVMGLDKALAYCDDHPEVKAIFVPRPEGRELCPLVRGLSEKELYFEDRPRS